MKYVNKMEDKKISKEDLLEKINDIRDEIRYKISEAKKHSGSDIESAYKEDIKALKERFNILKNAHSRLLENEKTYSDLETSLSSIYEEKEEDPKKIEERSKLQTARIESFDELIDLASKIKNELPRARKKMEQFYKNNPKSYSSAFNVEDIKEKLQSIYTQLTGTK